jgi:hypothetical protein
LAIYAARKRKNRDDDEEEEEGEGGEEGVMAAGGGGAVPNARRRRRRGGSENPLGAKIDGAGATTPPQQLRLRLRSKQHDDVFSASAVNLPPTPPIL